MKKMFFVLAISTAFFACNGPAGSDSKPVSTNDANGNSQMDGKDAKSGDSAATTTASAGKDGAALIAGSDCRTCHKDDAKLIGPAYQEVANKYTNDDKTIKMLAEKVMKGGTGVWGQIPMAAHPNLSQDDAEAMVKYVLSLKK